MPDFDLSARDQTVTIPTAKLGERISVFSDIEYPKTDELAKLFEKTSPAVVQLFTESQSPSGSGFFTAKDGEITTAYHCVQFHDHMVIRTADNKQYTATVVDIHPSEDTAHLRIDGKAGDALSFPFLKIREKTTDLRGGDLLVALGHPQELTRTFMAPGTYVETQPVGEQGIVPVEASGRNNLLPLIKASMHVEGGNSGGPVVDRNGEVVGLTSSGNQTTDQIIPAETIRHSFGRTAQPLYPSFIPHELAWGAKATTLATEGVIVGGARLMPWARPASLVAPVIGAAEFAFQDLTPLIAAYHSGTKAEKVSASMNVLGDVLMIGSVAAASRGYGVAIAVAGIGLKLANNGGDRRRFW